MKEITEIIPAFGNLFCNFAAKIKLNYANYL